MNRLEPNLLLAVATVTALILLIMTASVYGEDGQTVKYVVLALVCIPAMIVGNSWLDRRRGQARPAMISAETPTTAVWAAIVPGLVMLAAGVPLVFGGYDYGLLVIIASVLTGVTVESAIKAGRGV